MRLGREQSCYQPRQARRGFQHGSRRFFDESRLVIDQTKEGEARELTFGMVSARLLAVVYTRRDDAYRIISARFANSRERSRYGKE